MMITKKKMIRTRNESYIFFIHIMERMLKTRLIINSSHRDTSKYPNPNSFDIELTRPIRNVRQIRVLDSHSPNCAKHPEGVIFMSELNSSLGKWVPWRITIPSEAYDSTTMATQLEASISSAECLYYLPEPMTNTYSITFDSHSNKFRMEADGLSGVEWHIHSRIRDAKIGSATLLSSSVMEFTISEVEESPIYPGSPGYIHVTGRKIPICIQSVVGSTMTCEPLEDATFTGLSVGPLSINSSSKFEPFATSSSFQTIVGLDVERDNAMEALSIFSASNPLNPSLFSYSAPNATSRVTITHGASNTGLSTGSVVLLKGGTWLGGTQIGSSGLRYIVHSVPSPNTTVLTVNLKDSLLRLGETLATDVYFLIGGKACKVKSSDLDMSSITFPSTGNGIQITANITTVSGSWPEDPPSVGDVVAWGSNSSPHLKYTAWKFVSSTDVNVEPISMTFSVQFLADPERLVGATMTRIFNSSATVDGSPVGGVAKALHTNNVDFTHTLSSILFKMSTQGQQIGRVEYNGEKYLFKFDMSSGNESRSFYNGNLAPPETSSCILNGGICFENLHFEVWNSEGTDLASMDSNFILEMELVHGA